MSSAKHTQGPWLHDTRGYPSADVRAASGRAVARTWGVCSSQPKTPEQLAKRTEEDRANARLIAAAPMLLEALQEITADYADRFDLNSSSTNPGIKSTIKQARAAIAAAKGEAA